MRLSPLLPATKTAASTASLTCLRFACNFNGLSNAPLVTSEVSAR